MFCVVRKEIAGGIGGQSVGNNGYQPQIIAFLGVNPTPCPDDLIGQFAWHKKSHGLNLTELGKQMKRDPEQLADWLSRRCDPCRRNREAIAGYLHPSTGRFVAAFQIQEDLIVGCCTPGEHVLTCTPTIMTFSTQEEY